jgi:CTP:molybdopterin cytidylyltransferase MocA
MKTAALLLAAGASSRFGSPKQLAVYRSKTLLEWAIEHATKAGCSPILVVTGKYAREIDPITHRLGAKAVHNPHWDWKQGMRLSVSYGLETLLEYPDWEGTFLLPTDLPWFTEANYLDFKVAMSVSLAPPAAPHKGETTSPGSSPFRGKVIRKVEQPIIDPQVAIDYPEGPGIPALLSRTFVRETNTLQLRKGLASHPDLILLPTGGHTKDVDYPEDLPTE